MTHAEIEWADHVARERTRVNASHAHSDGITDATSLFVDTVGARSEAAVSHAFPHLTWYDLVEDFTTVPGDVGPYQIRGTQHRNGRLWVYENDDNAAPFILVIDKCPFFTLVGWLYGGEAKRWPIDRQFARAAHWVPQRVNARSNLHPMESLPAAEMLESV